MDRRQMMQVAAGTALAHGLVTVLACQAETKPAGAVPVPPPSNTDTSPVTPELARLADAASGCVRAAETCLEHCIRSLASGSAMLKDCARLVEEMLPVCRALASLSAMGSKYARSMAGVCAEACEACAAECEKHASHHAECKACFDACKTTAALARALT